MRRSAPTTDSIHATKYLCPGKVMLEYFEQLMLLSKIRGKKIDSAVYNKHKAEFDKLVSGASLYNGVRSDVGNYIQRAVDALYRFRSDKLCADIASDVLKELAK